MLLPRLLSARFTRSRSEVQPSGTYRRRRLRGCSWVNPLWSLSRRAVKRFRQVLVQQDYGMGTVLSCIPGRPWLFMRTEGPGERFYFGTKGAVNQYAYAPEA